MNLDSDRVSGRGPEFSLVIPFYNEAESASETVSNLLTLLGEASAVCRLILVNNGSRDATGRILESFAEEYPWIRVVTVKVNQGYGWGILCGLRAATTPYVGYMCGDGQIAADDVLRVYQRLREENLDLCKVERVVRHDGFRRKLLSKVYNFIFPLLFHVRDRDINGTPKLMRRQICEELGLTSKDWFIDAELMIKAQRRAYRMGVVKVEFLPRMCGRSNVGLITVLEFIQNMIRYRLGLK